MAQKIQMSFDHLEILQRSPRSGRFLIISRLEHTIFIADYSVDFNYDKGFNEMTQMFICQ